MILVDDQGRMIRSLGDLQRHLSHDVMMDPVDLLWLADYGVVGIDKCLIEMGRVKCPKTGDWLAEVRVGFLIEKIPVSFSYSGRPELVITVGGPLLFFRQSAMVEHGILKDGELYRFASKAFVSGRADGAVGMWDRKEKDEQPN